MSQVIGLYRNKQSSNDYYYRKTMSEKYETTLRTNSENFPYLFLH